MKSLYKYLKECDLATPMNTMGMGNPSIDCDVISEPIGCNKNKKRASKKKLLKK